MACSAHLVSQSLYSSHRASPGGPRNLRSQGRPPARASPAARPGSRASGCRGVSLRVAASFEQGRRQVEVSAFQNPQLWARAGEFGKDCSDCWMKWSKPKDSAALFVCYVPFGNAWNRKRDFLPCAEARLRQHVYCSHPKLVVEWCLNIKMISELLEIDHSSRGRVKFKYKDAGDILRGCLVIPR